MSHSHDHHEHHHSATAKGLRTAFWLNLSFSILEFIGGFYANSSAIITDAIHDLGDAIAIGLGSKMEQLSNRPADSRYTQGYRRFSILSAIILSSILIVGASVMFLKAIYTFGAIQEVKSDIMFYLAVFGILINGFAFLRIWKAEKNKGNNTKAVMFHLLEDVLGWIAVLVGSIIIYFTNWYWIDPLLSVLISIYILSNAIPNLISSFKILLQHNPIDKQYEQLRTAILLISEVDEIEQFHIFTLDGTNHIASLRILLSPNNSNKTKVKTTITELLLQENIENITIELR